jgi:uncharacterized repeat protein (TIGR01451 family)
MSAEIDRGSYPKDVARLLARHAPGLLGAAFVAALALAPAAALAGEPSTGPGVSGSWLSQVQQGIASEEYQVTWQTETALPDLDAAWQAPNRSHGLRTYFTAAGIRVVPRQDAAPSWEWGLAWVGYGRGGMSWAVPAARLAPAGARVDYQRGALAEWYENSPRGLKQGFVLDASPEQWSRSVEGEPEQLGSVAPGRGRRLAAERLVHVDLALTGSLRPVVSEDGLAIDFEAPGGARVVHFAELAVTDARGKPLAAWMEGYAGTRGGGIRIVIDDAGAVYPITVDPLATGPSWTAESDQAGANFGVAVAPAGDVNGDGYADVIVGAYFYDNGQTDEGRAYVYLGSASGPAAMAAWTAESDQASALFGNSVATAGDVNGDGYADVIVGAFLYDNGQANEGRAFVYLGSAAGLAATAAWTAESDQASAYFGWSVATAGDVNGDGYADVIVGAYFYDNGQADEGRAFVYLGSAAGLAATAAWSAESDQANARFSYSVATAGDVNGDGYADVIVGAYFYDNDQTDEGRAYVYLGSAAGLAATAAWTAESDQANADFGYSVATAGDINGDGYADVIVGALNYDNGQADEGRAFVYLGSAAGLAATAVWMAESDQAYAWFGYSVAPAGDVNGDGYADVIVGAYQYDNGQTDEGRAFVYFGSAAGLATTAAWTAESDQAGANFGYSVATAGDVNGDGYADVIVGSYFYDNGQTDEGRAYVYLGSAAGPAATAGWTAESDQAFAQFGSSVATAGDVNGDGYADVIVGAHYYDNGQSDEGRAYVYLGSAAGPAATVAWTAESDQASALFGNSVATAGDVNGDGYADVIVGAYRYDNGQADEGRAYVYLGSAAGLAATAAWTAESDQDGASFGVQVATAGDVNGDGYADVIVGAYLYDNDQADEGRAFVYLGSAAGLAATAAWTAESDQADARFGTSVATAGDVNGDGYADVIVGAHGYDNDQDFEGRAYVYLGSAAGLAATAAWTAEGDQEDARFGTSVATAGDVNGDGYADVIVGAPYYDYWDRNTGRASVYLGSATGLAATAAWHNSSFPVPQVDCYFGRSVATAGDVNGDGYADVIVGADRYDNSQTDEGRAYVFLGSAAGPAAAAAWTAESDQADAMFGYSVATAGDVNGDGYADVIVGAWHYGSGQTLEGRAYLYYGNGVAGRPLRPRQVRSDGSPIAHLGSSDRGDGFTLGIDARSPFGRGMARLQWEVKPLGTLFDGGGLGDSGAWVDTGTGGSPIEAPLSGLLSGRMYHWRARVLYDPVRSPFAQKSRWFTVPWNGWQEADLRTEREADLLVSQTDSPDPQFTGQPIEYLVTVSNAGPSSAAATLVDTLPPGSAYILATPSQGSCSHASGVVTCALGELADGGAAQVSLLVSAPGSAGIVTNVARVEVVSPARDPYPANNTSSETTDVRGANIGDFVWRDDDGDGIQDAGEPGIPGVAVLLYDGGGALLQSRETNANGYYVFPYLTLGAAYQVRFIPPTGYEFSPRDAAGSDDTDSDADPVTGRTVAFSLTDFLDALRWDAGLIPDADGDGAFLPADCNEADPSVHPGAPEVCNGWDDDCDGRVDETCDARCDLPAEIADEIDLTPTATNAGAPRIAWTGTEYGMVVSDNHEGDYEIYFSRFDAAFGAIGSEVRVTNATGSSASPYLAWNGTEFGVAWQDDRDGNVEIYFTRLDASGNKIGGDVRVTNDPAVSQRPRIEWSGISWGLLWTDTRDGSSQQYFVELDASGHPVGAERRVTPLTGPNSSGRFAWNGSVYGVVYNTARAGIQHVGFQTLDRHGDAIVPETLVTSVTASVRTPVIAWDGVSQFGISWIDNRSGADQLFFTRIAADGTKLTGDHPLVGLVSTASVPQMLVHSGSEWALTWIDQTVGNAEVYFARVAGDALANVPVRVSDNPATAQNPALEWSGSEYAIAFAENRAGASTYHVFGARIGCCSVSTLGDRVWRDADVDGIQDPGETGVPGVLVAVYDETGALLDVVTSGVDGSYQISGLTCGAPYELRFFPPGNEYLSPANQGTDDALDSDPDPLTGSTGLFALTSAAGSTDWDAGIAACWAPDEPVYIYRMTVTADGNHFPVIHFQDPNQPSQITGYNVRRSSTAAPPPEEWPLVATDVIDMDEAEPNKQWVDQSGDVSPTGVWFYQVTAYNHGCPAEGPF